MLSTQYRAALGKSRPSLSFVQHAQRSQAASTLPVLCHRLLSDQHHPTSTSTSTRRSLSTSTPRHPPNRPPFGPPPPPPGQGGGGGLGNIFGSGQPEPGATLKENSIDLTQLAEQNKLDPTIGRDEEIKRVVQILGRRGKNNPVLLGEAGVGKTAIVEGIALRIRNGEVPESLLGKRVLSIDLGGLIAGTGVRGSFEEKLKNLIQDIQAKQHECICFIDELHSVLKLGAAEGSVSGGNMLKPALARGLQIVGATTYDEYKHSIEKDAALARRFQPVYVDEPSVEATVTMLRGLRGRYEAHHGVQISDSALVTAASMARRYVTTRVLPDSAIDLVDEASSALALQQEAKPEPIEVIERQMVALNIERESLRKDTDAFSVERRQVIDAELVEKEAERERLTGIWQDERSRLEDIKHAKRELEEAQNALVDAQRSGDYARASQLMYEHIPRLQQSIPTDQEALASQAKRLEEAGQEDMLISDRVTSEDIARVVGRATGIPVRSLLRGEVQRLMHLEDELRKRVVGQDYALHAVSQAVRMSRAGLNNPNRPIASFLFLGPTGTGKTELSKTLSSFLFDSDRALVTINMSEYSERYTVSRLLGAAPGLVGYEEGGQLTEPIRKRPYAVILLDEFEKAHPQVSNILLQILDEGKLTDSQGRAVDFKNTIIIMTSNLGSHILADPASSDAAGVVTPEASKQVLDVVAQTYPPELLNRLDQQIVFNRLSQSSMHDLVNLRLAELASTLEGKRLKLIAAPQARDWLAAHGYSAVYGARELNRLINKQVRSPIADQIISGKLQPGSTVHLTVENDQLLVTAQAEAEELL